MSIANQTQELLYHLLSRIEAPTAKDQVDIIYVINEIRNMENENDRPTRCEHCVLRVDNEKDNV
jgi:hypothetical protein